MAKMYIHKKTDFFINLLNNFRLAQNYQTFNQFQDFNPLNAGLIIWVISLFITKKPQQIDNFPYDK